MGDEENAANSRPAFTLPLVTEGPQGEWDLCGLLTTKEGHSTFFGTHVLFWSYPKAGKIETHIGRGQGENG